MKFSDALDEWFQLKMLGPKRGTQDKKYHTRIAEIETALNTVLPSIALQKDSYLRDREDDIRYD